jgi:hypothetical protein
VVVVSVLIVAKFPGDTAVFKKALADRPDELAGVASQARAVGGIHHRFGVGDGFVIIVDEWESPQHFEQFFAREDIQALVGAMGASGPPDITIAEAISSPDQY